MELTPNLPLVLMLWLPFAVAVVALKFLLVDPMYAWLQGRHDATIGARHEAEKLQHDAIAQASALEARLASARDAAARVRADHVARGQDVERQVLGEARAQAEARLAEAVSEIRAEAEVARASVPETARAISHDIAGQLLGRSVTP
jgi:F0F1-type ATP synthase membrane subunit b/b'